MAVNVQYLDEAAELTVLELMPNKDSMIVGDEKFGGRCKNRFRIARMEFGAGPPEKAEEGCESGRDYQYRSNNMAEEGFYFFEVQGFGEEGFR
ncbi:hypothetical protein U1Q18_041592 [Sarracenia purpurea var. burkii]